MLPNTEVTVYFEGRRECLESASAEATADFLLPRFEQAGFVEVYRARNGSSLGVLMIWLNGTRAVLRVEEHREHYASDPTLTSNSMHSEERFLDVGWNSFGAESFTETFSKTVTKAQALAAALYWLDTGEKWQGLEWS